MKPTFYFVLGGLINGDSGYYATTVAEVLQEDGWYFLFDGMDDGIGPFESRQEAAKEAFLYDIDARFEESAPKFHIADTRIGKILDSIARALPTKFFARGG